MEGNGSPHFKVGHLNKAKKRLHELEQRAKALGLSKQLAKSLREITDRLEFAPLEWGEPHYHTILPGGVVRHAVWEGLSVRFVAYEQQRLVFLIDILPLANHPLSEQ